MSDLQMPSKICDHCKKPKLKALFQDHQWNRKNASICRACVNQSQSKRTDTGRRQPELSWANNGRNAELFNR